MSRRVVRGVIPLVVVAALVAAIVVWRLGSGGGGYTVTIVFPAASNLNTGGLVEVNGFTVGNVKHLGVNNGQAMVQVSLNSANAPLHDGTTASIMYQSLLGERYVDLVPGPKSNPVIPNGHMIINNQSNTVVPRVEIDQIVSQLDPATRTRLTALIPQLDNIVKGQGTQNTQATLQSAEPTVKALAQVLDAVGADGQTLHQLVTDMAGLSTRLVNRQGDLVNTVQGLDTSMSAVAQQTSSLSQGINQLPSTLTQAQATLDQVPGTTAAALPLLSDLRTTSADLPAFSAKLQPVLTVLQPVSQKLVPTFIGLDNLLHFTPALNNSLNATVPQVTQAATELQPSATTGAVSFLRPYTPELAGFLTNWGNTFSNYDNTGHLGPVDAVGGPASLNINSIVPGLDLKGLLPGLPAIGSLGGAVNTTRTPGALVGVVDAAGNGAQ